MEATLPFLDSVLIVKVTAAAEHLTPGAAAQISLTQSTPRDFYQVPATPKNCLSTQLTLQGTPSDKRHG